MEYKKLTHLSMFLALSIVLSILESLLPLSGIIPGMKLGIANIMIVLTLYLYGRKEAFFLSILRVFLMGILRTGLFSVTFFFSLTGAIFSIGIMALFYQSKLSIIGISILGSMFHSIGQMTTAIILLQIPNMIYYLPWMIILSIFTGTLTGYLSKQALEHIQIRL